jgi:lactoylglutathione lyase
MKFNWCTIQVKDLEESLKFYQEVVGLTIDRRFQSGSDTEIVFLGDGETKLELICNKGTESITFGSDISLGFQADSLDKIMELLKNKNIPVYGGPFQPNPHIRFIYVLDPSGLKIQFSEDL